MFSFSKIVGIIVIIKLSLHMKESAAVQPNGCNYLWTSWGSCQCDTGKRTRACACDLTAMSGNTGGCTGATSGVVNTESCDCPVGLATILLAAAVALGGGVLPVGNVLGNLNQFISDLFG